MGTPAQIAKFYKEEQGRLQAQAAQTSQDLADSEKAQVSLQKQIGELESRLTLTVSDLASNQSSTRDALTKMEEARKLKLSIAG